MPIIMLSLCENKMIEIIRDYFLEFMKDFSFSIIQYYLYYLFNTIF